MQKIGNTNVKTYSKVSEFESADTVQIVEDILDYNRGQSVANGVVVSRQKGARRLIDRNKIAHTEVDYSQFKVTKIEEGVTVDNSKKEAKIEEEAMKLLADLGIDWSDDIEEEAEEEENQPEISEQQTVSNDEEVVESEQPEIIETQTDRIEDETIESDSEEIPDDFDSLIADIINSDSEAIKIDPADMNWNDNYGYDIRYRKMW
jgi:hypothetical protein